MATVCRWRGLGAKPEVGLRPRLRYRSLVIPSGMPDPTLAMVSSDQFNDRSGRDIGDDVLIGLVASIHNILRQPDRLYRWCIEELTLLMPQTGTDGA